MVTLYVYQVDLSSLMYVTIAHPTGATHMRNGSTRQKHYALSVLEANKIAKYEHRCNLFHSDFVPLIDLWWNIGKI